MRNVTMGWVLLALLGCGTAPMVGDPCGTAAECPGGLCQDIGFASMSCTQSCNAEAPCPAPYVCSGEMTCARACVAGTTSGGGATRSLCVGSVFVACSTLGAALNCVACGCEPFGGGVCLAGRGCVQPAEDGTSCLDGEECQSGTCYSDTRVCGPPRADGEVCAGDADCAARRCLSDGLCGAPRAMGGECRVDADCATMNCSTNGDESRVGVCHQPLGTSCTRDTTTCDYCPGADTLSDGWCLRRNCDPVDAPNCPTIRDHRFECGRGVDGMNYCYERCSPDEEGETRFHRCLSAFDTCAGGGNYCQ